MSPDGALEGAASLELSDLGEGTTAPPRRVDPDLAEAVVRRAQEGDPAAFGELYKEHVGRVHAICLRICADRARAEELTQDVFVRVWEKLWSFRGESRFSTWLYRLAVNVAIQSARTETKQRARFVTDQSAEELESSSRQPPRAELSLEVRIDLERAVSALPPGARTVLVLRDIEGYKYKEVAELTGLALGTVKAQIHRARRLLRERLGG